MEFYSTNKSLEEERKNERQKKKRKSREEGPWFVEKEIALMKMECLGNTWMQLCFQSGSWHWHLGPSICSYHRRMGTWWWYLHFLVFCFFCSTLKMMVLCFWSVLKLRDKFFIRNATQQIGTKLIIIIHSRILVLSFFYSFFSFLVGWGKDMIEWENNTYCQIHAGC